MAVEKSGKPELQQTKHFRQRCFDRARNIGVSRNGPRLIQELLNITFRGLSGNFHFLNGQLEASVFEIVNINGNGDRRVGFWTPQSGLVFPKGSPLVADISREILNVTQGVASTSALVVFAAMFLYEQRHVLFRLRSETSIWRRVRFMSKIFDEKDMNSHTFRKTEPRDASLSDTNCPPSPLSFSNQTDSSGFAFTVEVASNTSSPDISPSPESEGANFPEPQKRRGTRHKYRGRGWAFQHLPLVLDFLSRRKSKSLLLRVGVNSVWNLEVGK
ncbi:hypothetical protein V6N11_067037 [Hibiscus sabdariffa]|uniref:Uncharacterized protein n=1 Tax=Hibiscus sabdariffa TaxID=183260 RepID=A0ABR2SPQ3_9ROSI